MQIDMIPEIPTNTYIIRDIKDIVPNMVSTKLKSNNPINNQFKAPIITNVRAIMFIVFIITSF